LLQLPGLAREVANRRRACASHLIFAALREARRRKGVNGERYISAAKHLPVLILSMISLLNFSRANHPRSPWNFSPESGDRSIARMERPPFTIETPKS
jgi:hypothetical protein